MNLATFHRISAYLHRKGLTRLARFGYLVNFLIFNSSVPPTVKIGKGSKFAYGGIGVVVHKNVVVGRGCIIGQGVTLGGRGTDRPGNINILDGAYIGAGARVLGPVTIGRYAIVGPNAVVLEDVPDGCVAVGVPARIVRRGITAENQARHV